MTKPAKKPARYRALVGLNYRPQPGEPETRVEPGELIDDLPAHADADTLIAQGSIERVEEA